MKERYLDIMEKSLSAYDRDRIRTYIDEVKRDGLTEHGFARMGANIGILLAHGRCGDYYDLFLEIMDICCREMPRVKAANDFTIREVCCTLMLLEQKEILPPDRLALWKSQLAAFDPWKFYTVIAPTPDTPVGNWAAFAGLSEYVRCKWLGGDATEFVDWEFSSLFPWFDESGMYMDIPPANPMVYDIVTRLLCSALLAFGYRGKLMERLTEMLDKTVDITLQMQSVTGEIPFGGRSNQFLHNEPLFISLCEMEARRLAKRGEMEIAAKLRGAAKLAAEHTWQKMNEKPLGHMKNHYDVDSFIGAEGYGYFNKYMITAATNIYLGLLFADETVAPATPVAREGGYAAVTSQAFHKVFLNAGGYFLEFDTAADFHYDANGLGRIHKAGIPSALCLTVPFPGEHPSYGLEAPNRGPMAICPAVGDLVGAEKPYLLRHAEATAEVGNVSFEVTLSPEITLTEAYHVTENGVEITLSGHPEVEYCIPVFEFDGKNTTQIEKRDNLLTITYQGATCTWQTAEAIPDNFIYYYNRNGRYRLYRVKGQKFRVTLDVLSK